VLDGRDPPGRSISLLYNLDSKKMTTIYLWGEVYVLFLREDVLGISN
jgi:hypothetical protein